LSLLRQFDLMFGKDAGEILFAHNGWALTTSAAAGEGGVPRFA
jgi:hypothetical protein